MKPGSLDTLLIRQRLSVLLVVSRRERHRGALRPVELLVESLEVELEDDTAGDADNEGAGCNSVAAPVGGSPSLGPHVRASEIGQVRETLRRGRRVAVVSLRSSISLSGVTTRLTLIIPSPAARLYAGRGIVFEAQLNTMTYPA